MKNVTMGSKKKRINPAIVLSFLIKKTVIKNGKHIKILNGNSVNIVPKEVPTPFPPLNFLNMDQLCPIVNETANKIIVLRKNTC